MGKRNPIGPNAHSYSCHFHCGTAEYSVLVISCGKWTSPFRLQDFFLHTDRGSVSEKKPCQLVCLSISTRVSFSFLFILFCLSFTTNCKCTSIMRPLTLFFSQLCQRLPRLFRHTFAQVDERSWDWWRDLDSHPCDQGWGRVPCVL